MRIQLFSDLHLEHSHRHPPFVLPAISAEVVVLAGDIDNGTRAIDWAEKTFPDRTVLYVPGNHEYYDAELQAAAAALKARAQRSANVQVLDNDELTIDGVRFLGSTLWTDFELFGREKMEPVIAESLKHVVDFRKIRMGGGWLTPQQTIELHRVAVSFLRDRLEKPFAGKTVVVTHHAPHPNSVHPRWAGSLANAAFVSDLTRLMGKSALWFHGHTHDSFDFAVHGTRVLANPMGYRTSNWREQRAADTRLQVTTENRWFDPTLVVEI
ncbi:MAG: metallophosphoesterase family protein [Betaproteobacteria bacterium]|nr:metallophosphoesterase family protein [Betaproteobacteria bacterium]